MDEAFKKVFVTLTDFMCQNGAEEGVALLGGGEQDCFRTLEDNRVFNDCFYFLELKYPEIMGQIKTTKWFDFQATEENYCQ